MSNQPNFLFIMTDQHRADWLGATGHPVVQTPHIDSIAQGGTIFDRCYVANPVCMPNRAAFMTGRYTSINGVRTNGVPQDPRANNFAKQLLRAGYDTALLGKAHFQHFSNVQSGELTEELHDVSAEAKRYYTESNHAQEVPKTWSDEGAQQVDLPYFGFNHADLVTLHGDICDGNYGAWLRKNHPEVAQNRGPKNQLPHDYTCPQAMRTAVPESLYHSHYISDIAVDYLARKERKEKPFFAFVSFPDPHHPFNPPGKYWDMYNPDDFEPPENFDSEASSEMLAWIRREQGTVRGLHMGPNPVTKREIQEAMALTAGMITMIDDGIGRILDQLRHSGLAENTIVVFTSDHGELLGDHGLIFKGPMHYQSVTRVPLIWNDPRFKQMERTAGIASTLDLCPTILASAGVPAYQGIQGKNLVPALQTGVKLREATLIEDDYTSEMCFDQPPRLRTIQTERYRMSIIIGEETAELYDLESDPLETNNIYNDPAYSKVQAGLVLQLVHLMGDAADRSPRRIADG